MSPSSHRLVSDIMYFPVAEGHPLSNSESFLSSMVGLVLVIRALCVELN